MSIQDKFDVIKNVLHIALRVVETIVNIIDYAITQIEGGK